MSMQNYFMNGYPQAYGPYANGMTYTQQKDLVWTNPLTQEEEKTLNKGSSSLSLDIPPEDMMRSKCTHRDPATRQFTLRPNADGSHTCLKCGATFRVVDNVSPENIEEIIGGTIDILQTIKMAYIDMTPEVVQSYFVILPFLSLAPKLYDAAIKTLNNALPGYGMSPNGVSSDAFFNLNNAVGMMGMPVQAAPMMGMPTGPMAFSGVMQQPQGQVPYNMNPMYQATPQQPQQPQMAPTAYTPAMGGQQPAPAPAAPEAPAPHKEGEAVQTSRTFELN